MNSWSRMRLRSAAANWAVLSMLLLVVAVLAVTVLTRGQVRIANSFMINVSVVVAMQTFIGTTGVLSFGHVAFLCLAAYAAALVTMSPSQKRPLTGLPEWLQSLSVDLPAAMAIAIGVVLVVALVFGAPIARMRQNVIPMATLALLVVTFSVINLSATWTRGPRGLAGVPALATSWSIFAVTCVIVAVALLFKASPWGLRAQAVREDEVAAAAFGISITQTRYLAWLVSAVLMAAAGTMLALNSLAFTPEQFFFAETFGLLAMLIIGGMGSVSGAVFGVVAVTVLAELLRNIEQGVQIGSVEIPELPGVVQFATAVLIIVLLALRPSGLFGNSELLKSRRRVSK